MAAENIRDIVLSMLLTVEKEEAYSHLLVKDVLEKYDYLPGQEKAFLKRRMPSFSSFGTPSPR